MASEEHDDGGISFAVPTEVGDWLERQASRHGETEEDVVRRLLVAAHAVTEDGDPDLADVDDLAELQGRLEAQREEFVELLEDVRARVVQVKRETDAKAPADHDHAEYAVENDLEELRSTARALEDDVDALEGTVDSGFENFEEILDHLLAESEKLEERSTILAREIVDLREKRRVIAERERRRSEAERLKLAANRLGIRKATCQECRSTVDIALLTEPDCPDCGSSFADLKEKSSIFGSHELLTGQPPALEGRVADAVENDRTADFEWAELETD